MFIVPSAIYLVQNNIQFLFLKYVDPSTYQILGNLKIATTGILFRVFLKRYLSKVKWLSLMLLLVGATTSQVSPSSMLPCFAIDSRLAALTPFVHAS